MGTVVCVVYTLIMINKGSGFGFAKYARLGYSNNDYFAIVNFECGLILIVQQRTDA